MTSLNACGWGSEALTMSVLDMVQQQELIELLMSQRQEVKVERISLPQFHGLMGDSVELYFD